MPKTKAQIYRETALRRQSILDWLAAYGPATRPAIAAALGMQPDILTVDLGILQARGHVEKANGSLGKGVTWRATGLAIPQLEHALDQARQKQHQAAMLRIQQQRAADATPGLRTERRLDKPASQTGRGGQAAITHYGSLQCGRNYGG